MNKTWQNPCRLIHVANHEFIWIFSSQDFMVPESYSEVITWPPRPSSGSEAVASSPPPPSLAASSPPPPVSPPSVSVALPAASVSPVFASPVPVVVSVSALLSL